MGKSRMLFLVTARTVAIVAGVVVIQACGPGESDLAERGRIEIDSVSSSSVAGRYVENRRTIAFETRLGPEKPSGQRTPDDPVTHEVDARLLSEDGFPFSMKIGGHAFIDDTWAEYEDDSGDAVERAEDFRMGRRMAKALAGFDWPGDASSLVALRDLGAANDDEALVSTPRPEGPGVALTPMSVSTTGYYHTISVPRKYVVALFGSLAGYHSATWAKDYKVNPPIPSTGLMQQVITCNHGTCADVMATSCSERFDNRPSTLPTYAKSKCGTFVGVNSHGAEVGCCNTWYDLGGSGHVCNDDSAVQLSLIRGYTVADLTNTCADGKLRKDPPASCLAYSSP